MWINYEEIRRKADQIRELCGDDEDTFLDTLDGECDAMDILGGLLTLREETKQNEKMNKELAATYKQRAERANNKQDATNILIKQLLDAMSQKKVQHPFGTVTITKPKQKVFIIDEKQIPTQLMTVKTSPDLTAIKKQLDQGEFVPGAEIQLGNRSISVRIK
jgi:hypothetical protein|tara:strand:+ start:1342 stop:1827 length:486 start_codon:yes stop_codon:yes gene_type:complete